MVSRELEKECIVVFDEAHNIDNICIEVGCSAAVACSIPATKWTLMPGTQWQHKSAQHWQSLGTAGGLQRAHNWNQVSGALWAAGQRAGVQDTCRSLRHGPASGSLGAPVFIDLCLNLVWRAGFGTEAEGHVMGGLSTSPLSTCLCTLCSPSFGPNVPQSS